MPSCSVFVGPIPRVGCVDLSSMCRGRGRPPFLTHPKQDIECPSLVTGELAGCLPCGTVQYWGFQECQHLFQRGSNNGGFTTPFPPPSE